MLKKRVMTALVLTTTFLLVLFFSSWFVFAGFVGGICCVAAWEWANLAGISNPVGRIIYALVTAVLGLAAAWLLNWAADLQRLQVFLLVASGWWCVALLWIQGYPSSAVIWCPPPMRLLMGWLVIVPGWIGCLYLRHGSTGAWLILLVVLVVAAADIGAYFSGRRFGRRKLAPNVSPAKSWEGVWGGLVLALLIGTAYNFLFNGTGWLELLIVVTPAALVSVVGDLLESMVKRYRGVKDSSQLLPGHGGVLDRIDGLLAAVPVFSLIMILTNWSL